MRAASHSQLVPALPLREDVRATTQSGFGDEDRDTFTPLIRCRSEPGEITAFSRSRLKRASPTSTTSLWRDLFDTAGRASLGKPRRDLLAGLKIGGVANQQAIGCAVRQAESTSQHGQGAERF